MCPSFEREPPTACITGTRRSNLGHPSGTVSPGASMTNRKYRAAVGLLSLLAIPSLTRVTIAERSEEHTSELQSRLHLVCRLLLEKKKKKELNIQSRQYSIQMRL